MDNPRAVTEARLSESILHKREEMIGNKNSSRLISIEMRGGR